MTAKILIVDDEPDLELLVRQKLRKQIRDKEYTFIFAHNGVEALEKLAQEPDVDLILTDINMPVMDGLTLLSKLSESHSLLQPVVVSAYGDMVNIRTAMNRGAFDFLTKPIDFQDFETTLTKTLERTRALQQAEKVRTQLSVIQRELTVATNIQKSILPRNFPPFPHRKDIDIFATMVPARNVGGDLYDFFLLDENRLGIVIGDVSGKGVPAAIFMAMSRTVVRTVALQGLAPGDCLRESNAILCADNDGEMFVTLFYGILNLKTGEMTYSNAGHNPPYRLASSGTPVAIESTGDTILGMLEGLNYSTRQTVLPAGEALFLYTDGVTEAMDVEGNQYTEKRLEAFLAGAGNIPTQDLINKAVAGVKEFVAEAPQSDDITVLAVRWLPA